MSSLYLKYRPQTFAQVIGQQHITKFLQAEIANSKIAHAYIFIGPRGTGKTSTARIFAKAVNCSNPNNGEPCGKCQICRSVQNGKFLDIIEIDAASNRGIDEIRSLKEKIEFKPVQGKYKVYIIDEVHMLTKEAFNALLKTLEEPPKHVIFILATTEPHKVPATILSRCEKYEFRLGNKKELKQALLSVLKQEDINAEPEAIELLIDHSGGSYRDLLSLLDTIISKNENNSITYEQVRYALGLPDNTMVFYYLQSIVNFDTTNLFAMLEEVFIKGVNIGQFIKSLIKQLEKIIVEKYKGAHIEGYEFIDAIKVQQLVYMLETLIDAYNSLKYALDYKLPLELATFKILNYLHNSNTKHNIVSSKINNNISLDVSSKSSLESKEQQVSKLLTRRKSTKDFQKTKSSQSTKSASDTKPTAKNLQVGDLNLEVIIKKWHLLIQKLKPYNGHLYAFLLEAVPKTLYFDKDLNVHKLEIGVRFNFHKQRIELPASQQAISKVAKEIFGIPIQVISVVLPHDEIIKLKGNVNISPSQNIHDDSQIKRTSREFEKKSSRKITHLNGDGANKKIKNTEAIDDFDTIFGEDVFEE